MITVSDITVADIRSALVSGQFENDELNVIVQAVKYAQAQLVHRNIRTFVKGNQVKFTNSRTGRTFQGVVEKVAIKYITVATSQGRYNVPANMLEAV